MKKYNLFLLPLLLFSFVSCGEVTPENKDFDGLLNYPHLIVNDLKIGDS